MADSDQSINNLRYNQITMGLEGFGGGTPQWTPLTLVADGGITQLTGDVTAGPGAGSQVATIPNAIVIGKLITGYVSGAGTVAATDTILQAINKLDGNTALKLPTSSFTDAAVTGKLLTGYVSGAGTVAATDTILQGIDKLNGNANAISTVANAALPSASFTDTAVTGKLLTGFGASAGLVAATDSILVAFQKEVGNQRSNIPGVSTPAGTGTVTPSATNSSQFNITVSGALTINGPSAPVDGQKIVLRILNDASHSVTLATGSGNFRFGTDITSYTNSVSLTDYIGAIWNNVALRWDVVSIIQGF